MASSKKLLLLAAQLLFVAASWTSPPVVHASPGGGGGGTSMKRTHIRVYVHERFSGPNSTVATVVPSPLGNESSTFGMVGALDDELRASPDAASPIVGRFRGVFVGTDLADDEEYVSSVTVVFTAGSDHHGRSTLSLQGQYRFPVEDDVVERAVVGGTGRFRRATGYSLLKVVSATTEAAVFQLDLFVFTPRAGY
ncbi:hypothetical protein PR202_ga29197 [Eleusine coracana subsp. coracana]|uniref:Dirigent protein n=1 Tax=Eleusine coracana subsp. coracana TaxID=191504 RepID=A0AAV5DJB5_ELECO|nr:hypothetical protein PR202_ga29172 [Eleusine coracana subsp. coracana]GJN11038.1 hypothetical protein PR202_ga29197 [Eleusine coracana subsp. coracana]